MTRDKTHSSSGLTENRNRRLKLVERLLWLCAFLCLVPFMTAWAARSAMEDMVERNIKTGSIHRVESRAQQIEKVEKLPDLLSNRSAWSDQRIRAFEKLKAAFSPEIVATLEFPAQESLIPVFTGENEINMTLGAAHLQDSAPLGSDGNIALTAHRDGTFRVLKDVTIGELIVLSAKGQDRIYKVRRSAVVSPDDIKVLDPTPVPTLTLITCYPFYYVGSAPQRYILQAELLGTPAELNSIAAGRGQISGDSRPAHLTSITEE